MTFTPFAKDLLASRPQLADRPVTWKSLVEIVEAIAAATAERQAELEARIAEMRGPDGTSDNRLDRNEVLDALAALERRLDKIEGHARLASDQAELDREALGVQLTKIATDLRAEVLRR